AISQSLMLVGAISILFGAACAMRQKDFKRMLAFSSISQTGYIILALGLASPVAILGAIFHMFNHATFKTVLFLNGASLEKTLNTANMEKMGGLKQSMPWTAGSSIIALMSTAGLPPLPGFWSKLVIIIALWQGGAKGYAVLAIGVSLATLIYFLILARKIFFGKITASAKDSQEMPLLMLAPIIILSVIILVSGLLFPYFYSYLIETGTRTIL
ncbi:MAG: NADH-quinone oxidoreductase subunit L, partial [Elusimicrobia bacterium]|nr:NADH-quinone oxidoreductase subunit L [Elusimicrobiota bacterium]